MKKTDSHVFIGMKRDLSPSRLEDKYLWEANNIRVRPIDANNTMGSITNEKGNCKVTTNIYDIYNENYSSIVSDNIPGIILGYCSLDKYLVLFSHDLYEYDLFQKTIDLSLEQYQIEDYIYLNATYDRIYRIEFVDREPSHEDELHNGHIVTLLYQGDLGFDIKYPIESFMLKESQYIYKAYWIDGINQFRYINITKDQLIGKYLNRTECNESVKEEISNPDTYKFYLYKDVYTLRNPFDMILQLDLNELVTITRRNDLNGIFPPCTILYVITYYNKYGLETNMVYISQLYNVSWKDRGGAPNDLVSCSFQIDVNNILKDFDYLRLYSIKRTSQNGSAEVKIVDEVGISDIVGDKTTKKYYSSDKDDDDNKLFIPIYKDELLLDAYVQYGLYSYKFNSDNTKVYIDFAVTNKSISILGYDGYTYELIDLDNIKYIPSVGYEFDVTLNDGYYCITPVFALDDCYIKYIYYVTNASHTFYDTNLYGEVIDGTLFTAKNRNIIIPKTMTLYENVLFLGNYKYDTQDIRSILKKKGYFKNSKYQNDSRASLDNLDIKYNMRSESLDDSDTGNTYHYVNQLSKNTSYLKWNENYRLGFQCLDKYGKWSDPVWIKDIGNGNDNNLISNRPYFADSLYLPYPYIDLTFDDTGYNSDGYNTKLLLYDLYNAGYRTIRPVVVLPQESDKRVIAQGVITPSVFLDYLRLKNSPYALPSWFIRPIMPIKTTDFGKMLFLEYRNMRPLLVPRSFIFAKSGETSSLKHFTRYYYSALLIQKDYSGNPYNQDDAIIGINGYPLNKYFYIDKIFKSDNPNEILNLATTVDSSKGKAGILFGCNCFDRLYCEIQNMDLMFPFNFQYIYRNYELSENFRLSRYNSSVVDVDFDTWNSTYKFINQFLSEDAKKATLHKCNIMAMNKMAKMALRGRYRVDLSIQTFHSPDIEFDEALKGLYFGNYDILIDGIIPVIDSNSINYKVLETESATAANALGYNDDCAEGLKCTDALYDDNAVDYVTTSVDTDKNSYTGYFTGEGGYGGNGSALGNWYVYPWLKHGSINNDTNRGVDEGVKSAVLKYNLSSYLRFMNSTLYFLLGKDDNNVRYTSNDLPKINCTQTMADLLIDRESGDTTNEDIDDPINLISLADALLWDNNGMVALKIDDNLYYGNIDLANPVFKSTSNNPYEVSCNSGCPNIWKGSMFMWDGISKVKYTDDLGGNIIYWGDLDLTTLDRSSGFSKPAFLLNSTPTTIDSNNGTSEKYDYPEKFIDMNENGSKYRFLSFEKGLDLNNDSVRIKYKTTPHLVLKFRLYGGNFLDSIFYPDTYVVASNGIQKSGSYRPNAIRVFAITLSYIDSFDRDEKKGNKKGESTLKLATNDRAIVNIGDTFTYKYKGNSYTFKHNHIYFYTGRGKIGYGLVTNGFSPGTLFVDLNDNYYKLTSNSSSELVAFVTSVGNIGNWSLSHKYIQSYNLVESYDIGLYNVDDYTDVPDIAGFSWNMKNKKWENRITTKQANYIEDWTSKMISEENEYPYLFQVSIINDNHDNVFGGETEYAIENNIWYPANTLLKIDLDNGNTIKWYYGDTWYQRYDCLRTYMDAPTDENQVTEIASFMVETNINIDGRYDRNRGLNNNTVMSPTNFNLINKAYTQNDNFFLYKILDGDMYKNDIYPNTIIWSLSKYSNAEIDNYMQITEGASINLDSKLGDITDLEGFHENVYAFQKNGFVKLKYNEKIQISTTIGLPIEVANSGKMDGYQIENTNIGCSNKWSVKVTDDYLYFIDSYTGSIYLIPDGAGAKKTVQTLSGGALFDTWCRKYYSTKPWYIDISDNYMKYTGIRTFYDHFNDNVYFTSNITGINDEDTDKQLMFDKLIMCFESYMPYWKNVVGMFNIEDQLYTILIKLDKYLVSDLILDDDGNVIQEAQYKYKWNSYIWLTWKGEYNKFYDNVEPYSITFISNKGKGDDGTSLVTVNKIFDNLSFIADVKQNDENKLKFTDEYYNDILPKETLQFNYDEDGNALHLVKDGYGLRKTTNTDLRRKNRLKKPFDHIRVWNEYQDSGTVPLRFNLLKPSNMKLSERKWNVLIPRDKKYKLLRMSNPWVYIKLSKMPNVDDSIDGSMKSDTNDFRMELHNMDVDFYIRS